VQNSVLETFASMTYHLFAAHNLESVAVVSTSLVVAAYSFVSR